MTKLSLFRDQCRNARPDPSLALEVANNRWREQMVADLRKVMKLNRAQSLLKAGRIEESLAEHAAIMAALKKRDAAAAQAAMRMHIESGQEAAG